MYPGQGKVRDLFFRFLVGTLIIIIINKKSHIVDLKIARRAEPTIS